MFFKALESYNSTFVKQHKHNWREPLTEDVNLLGTGMSKLIDSNVHDIDIERRTPFIWHVNIHLVKTSAMEPYLMSVVTFLTKSRIIQG